MLRKTPRLLITSILNRGYGSKTEGRRAGDVRRWLPRLTAAIGAAAVLVVSVGCGRGFVSDESRAAGEPPTADVGNLRLSVPTPWAVRALADTCHRLGAGILVSNLDQTTLAALRRDLGSLPPGSLPGSCTNAWDLTAIPATFVMLDVSQFDLPGRFPQTQFPVSEEFFPPSALDCSCTFRSNFIANEGTTYNVRIWVGDEASDTDRKRMACVIASIRPSTGTAALPNCDSGGESG